MLCWQVAGYEAMNADEVSDSIVAMGLGRARNGSHEGKKKIP